MELNDLTALSSLGSWRVSEGEPDIRGWEVRTVSGRRLGAISDLLIDAGAGEVEFLDVDLTGTDRHVFVPFRVVAIDRARRIVLMDSADVPESDLARDEHHNPGGRSASDVGVVRYPAIVRQAEPEGDERRRADRRRIHRMNTDL